MQFIVSQSIILYIFIMIIAIVWASNYCIQGSRTPVYKAERCNPLWKLSIAPSPTWNYLPSQTLSKVMAQVSGLRLTEFGSLLQKPMLCILWKERKNERQIKRESEKKVTQDYNARQCTIRILHYVLSGRRTWSMAFTIPFETLRFCCCCTTVE